MSTLSNLPIGRTTTGKYSIRLKSGLSVERLLIHFLVKCELGKREIKNLFRKCFNLGFHIEMVHDLTCVPDGMKTDGIQPFFCVIAGLEEHLPKLVEFRDNKRFFSEWSYVMSSHVQQSGCGTGPEKVKPSGKVKTPKKRGSYLSGDEFRKLKKDSSTKTFSNNVDSPDLFTSQIEHCLKFNQSLPSTNPEKPSSMERDYLYTNFEKFNQPITNSDKYTSIGTLLERLANRNW